MADKSTIDAYNKYPQAYDDVVASFWKNFPKSVLQDFTGHLPGEKVLDLGSGSGRGAVLLRDAGLEVTCVDAAQAMVVMTRQLGFETQLADLAEVTFPPESFAGVWAYTSLVHVSPEQARATIEHIHTWLKPDGLFMIGAISGGVDGMVEHKSMPGAARYFKFYEHDELKQLIEPLGFSLVYRGDYRPAHRLLYLNQIYRVIK